MTQTAKELAGWPLDLIQQFQAHYRAIGDEDGVARCDRAFELRGYEGQTSELENCGKLIRRKQIDPFTNRVYYDHVGDMSEFLAPFIDGGGPITGSVNRELFTGRNSPEAKAHAAEQNAIYNAGLAALGKI